MFHVADGLLYNLYRRRVREAAQQSKTVRQNRRRRDE